MATATSLKIVSASASGFKIAVATTAGMFFGNVPQKFDLPGSRRPGARHADRARRHDVGEVGRDQERTRRRCSASTTRRRAARCWSRARATPRRSCAARNRAARSSSPPNTKVKLTAVVGEDAMFGGFHQYPMRTPPRSCRGSAIRSAACLARQCRRCGRAAGDVLDCAFAIEADTDVAAEFGEAARGSRRRVHRSRSSTS